MKRRGKTKVFVEVSTVTCSLLVVMEDEGEVPGGRTELSVPTALSETQLGSALAHAHSWG